MLTGSVALNCYAQPRMTRDIDLVVAFFLKDAERIQEILGTDYYVSEHAAREAVSQPDVTPQKPPPENAPPGFRF